MFLKYDDYESKLQDWASQNHTDVNGLFELLNRFKPHRMPYELICKLLKIKGVQIDVCPCGDLVYNSNYADYSTTYKLVKLHCEEYGYLVCGYGGYILKTLDKDNIVQVGELR